MSARLAFIPCLGAFLALSAALVASGTVAAAAPEVPRPPVVLAVWGLADGGAPLSGATVSIAAGAGRSACAPPRTSGWPAARAGRTASSGAALIEAAQLPQTFSVVVSGGRVRGQRFRGAFCAAVRNYRSGTVVYVNPVATLVADAAAAGRGRSFAAAHRRIYRLLGIPGWADNQDLSLTRRYFDGRRYLAAARRAGGVAALDRKLVAQALHGKHPHRFRMPGALPPSGRTPEVHASKVDWLGLLSGDPRAFVKEAFKALAIQAGKSLLGAAANKGGNAALGWVLAAFGYADVLKDQDIREIRLAVEAIGKQVTALQGSVALSGFSTLFHQTDRTIGQINHAYSQLALLANMPDKDPTKAAFAKTISDYIGDNLVDAPEILNQALGSHVALADNLIKSASRLISQRGRFFTPKSSAAVESVYDYFATYQAQLAMLLQEYYHAKPDTFSPTVSEANLKRVEAHVNSQAGSLKPPVPPKTVIDTKSGEMWITDLAQPSIALRKLISISYKSTATRKTLVKIHLLGAAGPTSVAGFPFGNWELPKMDAYQRLIDGWSGKSPAEWLEKQAGFSRALLDASDSRKWARDGFSPRKIVLVAGIDADTFRLTSASRPRQVIEFSGKGWEGKFDQTAAGLMYVRKVAADESYWWSG